MANMKILIIENEAVEAQDIAERLARLGHEVIAIVSTVEEASRQMALMPSRQLDELLRDAIESLPLPFSIINADDYTIELANKIAREDQSGSATTCFALTHQRNEPCSGKEYPCPMVLVKETKEPVRMEHTHNDPGGQPRTYEIHGYPGFDQDGNVVHMFEYTIDITERRKAEQELDFARERLRTEHEALRQKDLALKAVLEQVEDQKKQVARQIGTTVERILIPLIARLEEKVGSGDRAFVAMLRDNLREIASPFVNTLEMQFGNLTPREIEICQMIKNDLTTREIAASLSTSVETVRNQRKSIRKKLSIANKSVNLGTFLKTM